MTPCRCALPWRSAISTFWAILTRPHFAGRGFAKRRRSSRSAYATSRGLRNGDDDDGGGETLLVFFPSVLPPNGGSAGGGGGGGGAPPPPAGGAPAAPRRAFYWGAPGWALSSNRMLTPRQPVAGLRPRDSGGSQEPGRAPRSPLGLVPFCLCGNLCDSNPHEASK
jgi:hypothetical protein